MCQPGRPGPISVSHLRLARFRRLPQREVAGVVLVVFVHVHPRAIVHAREVLLRELAVLGKLRDSEVVGAVVGAVGEALLLKSLDEVGHLLNVVGGVHQEFGMLDVQRVGIFQKRLLVLLGVVLDADARAAALRMILSSTSVMFITCFSL